MAPGRNDSPSMADSDSQNFLVVRLGPASKDSIKRIDGKTATPFDITVKCKQVPASAKADDVAIIYLGSDNNKGGATTWIQGIRAVGKLKTRTGGAQYNDESTLVFSVDAVIPRSLTKKEIGDQTAVPYRLLSNIPVVGLNNYSSQVVQCIDPTDSSQNVRALFKTIESLSPGFCATLTTAMPELGGLLNGIASEWEAGATWAIPTASFGALCGLIDVEESALRAFSALQSGMHVIFTGPPGTGKTKLAECICRTAGFSAWTISATDQWTSFETIGGYFPTPHIHESPAQEVASELASGSDRLDFLPGAIVDSILRGQCVIIDEINRADIDKAFGELFTLLSGSSVTLPFRRRSKDGFRRVRLVVSDVAPEADIDDVPVPKWWRIIGAMNDADKASLKRMSLAFIRRFAFIPVGLPTRDKYEELLATRTADSRPTSTTAEATFGQVLTTCNELFADCKQGFGGIGMPFGPAIPLAMLAHAATELASAPNRLSDDVLGSLLELYVAPQFQGRADKHDGCLDVIRRVLSKSRLDSFEATLNVWTGNEAT